MHRKIKCKKINNKGNTLGIVLVGIILLAILGTLILNLTAANYKMKIVEEQSNKNFYRVEKAVDEIYAGLGTEVLSSMSDAYQSVMTGLISFDGTSYSSLPNEQANSDFKEAYFNNLKAVYFDDPTKLDIVIDHLKGFIDVSDTNYTFTVEKTATTSVIYDTTSITLKDICVKGVKSSGYSVSLTTDFIITAPDVTMCFNDSSTRSFGELFEYVLVARGNGTSELVPTIDIRNHDELTNITGGVYAGSNDTYRKDSILLESGTNVIFKSKNIINRGSFVVNNAIADLGGEAMNLYTRNIRTQGESQSNVTINGNCLVADDLEVNGYNSVVKISGNYYGYGFDATGTTENDSTENTKFDTEATATTYEHEKRSAIMINGKGADVDLTGVDQLVLGGRAYIDLKDGDATSGLNSTYMTGESVSFKGNQNVYLSPMTDLGSVVVSNPEPYTSLTAYVTPTGLNYTALGIDSTKVVAKRVGDNVFFYRKNVNPAEQTLAFMDAFNITNRASIQSQIDKLELKNLRINEANAGNLEKVCSAGTIMQVKDGTLDKTLISPISVNNIASIGTDTKYSTILNNLSTITQEKKKCYELAASELIDYRGVADIAGALVNDTNPYDSYINQSSLSANFGALKVIDAWSTLDDTNKQRLKDNGYNETQDIKIVLWDNAATNDVLYLSDPSINAHIGFVVCSGDVVVSDDFKGLVICGGDMTLQGDTSSQDIVADKNLATILADGNSDLLSVLKNYVAGLVSTTGGTGITVDDIKYKDLITTANWRKNSN